MASGLVETGKGHFEITYEKPWGGVASNADPSDIQDNQLVTSVGVIDIDGILCQVNLVSNPSFLGWTAHSSGDAPYLIFNLTPTSGGLINATQLFAVSFTGNFYTYDQSTGKFVFIGAAPDAPWANQPDAVKVINNIAYISNFGNHTIYTFDGTTVLVGSAYTGGKYLGVLDDYLLQINTNSAVDGNKPTRVNWSAPGAFTTWDPAIDRTAGFNTLPSVEDFLTGFISLASVGIVVSKKGLTEVSPTGVGIQPFSFTTLWTSDIGQGSAYPDTLVQYGQSSYLVTDSGAYKVSTQGFQDVSGAAKKALLQQATIDTITQSTLSFFSPAKLVGSILLYATNSRYPTPYYVFVFSEPVTTNPPGSHNLVVWMLNLETGSWTNQVVSIDTLVNRQNATSTTGWIIQDLEIASVQILEQSDIGQAVANLIVFGNVVAPGGGTIKQFIGTLFATTQTNLNTDFNAPSNLDLLFKQHQLKLWRQPTINRILIKAFGSGTLTLSINGQDFGLIVLDGSTTPNVYLSQKGVYTGQNPQLTITSNNFKGAIVKIVMAGTYGDGNVL